MSDPRRFDSLETTVAKTAQRVEDKTSTLANRLASHTHLAEEGADVAAAVAGYRITGDTKNRLTILADGSVGWSDGTIDPDVYLYRSAPDTLALLPADHLVVRGVAVHEQPFARYYCNINPTGSPSGQAITANGAVQNIPFDVAQDTHSDITRNGTTTFTLGRAGVWTIGVGYRLQSAATGVHQLMVWNGASSAVRYGESQQNPGSGNSITVCRRFPAGAVVAAGLAIVGSSGSSRIAVDVPESTYIYMKWERS